MKRLFTLAISFVLAGVFYAQSGGAQAVRLSPEGKLSNTIIFQNPKVVPIHNRPGVSYSATDSLIMGLGNIRLLSSPFSEDYRISSSSPSYNSGNTALMTVADTLDLDYRPRVSCLQVDMGAYEVHIVTTQLTLQPQPQHVCEGDPLILRAQAQGTNLTYQWQRNGQNLVGKVSANLALIGALSDTGSYRVIAIGDCCNDTSDWVRVTVDAKPMVVAMSDTAVLSESDVTLRIFSSEGGVHWLESDQTTLVLDTLIRDIRQTVQYIAVATNGICSMEARDMVTIAVIGSPCRVTAKEDTTICLGDPYRLLVENATVDYKWYIQGSATGLPSFSVVRPLDTMRFVVIGTNELGETCSDTVQVSVRKVALKAMADRAVCSGSEVQLSSVPVADAWYMEGGILLGHGNNIKVIPPMNLTTAYIARKSDGVCSAEDTVLLYANPPTLQALFTDTLVCAGSPLHLQTNIDPALVVWKRKSTGENLGPDPIILVTEDEIYQGWAYDALCGDIFVESVVKAQQLPSFRVVKLDTACAQTSVFLSSTPNASYWRLEDGTRVSNPIVAVHSQSYVGVYTEGVCTVEDTLKLEVSPRPDFVAMGDTTIRRGQAVTLSSTPTASYWQVMDSSQTLASLLVSPEDTTLYVASLDAGVCGLLHDTVTVFVQNLDTFSLVLIYDNGCGAGQGWGKVSVVDDGQQNTTYRYLWSTGSQDSLIEGLSAGTYTVTVSNSRGVQVVASFTLLESQGLHVSVQMREPDNEQCDGGEIRVTVTGGTPGYEYQWSHGSVSPDLLNISAGVYHLTVTDSKGCEAESEVRLSCKYRRVMPTLFITPNADGKNDYLDIKQIELYPNNRVIILNSYGEEIVKLTNYDNHNVFWDGRNRMGEKIPDGIYYYIIEAEGVESMAGWIMMKLSKSN